MNENAINQLFHPRLFTFQQAIAVLTFFPLAKTPR